MGKNMYIVGKCMNFMLEDDSPIVDHENLVADILNEGMKIHGTYQANMLSKKLHHHRVTIGTLSRIRRKT